MTADKNTLIAVDSLVANEFEVQIEGQKVLGVFRVSGLTPFKLNVLNPGASLAVHEPFQLAKMVRRDANSSFNKWLRETVAHRTSSNRPKRTLSIVAIDDGIEIRRWTAKGAYITGVTYSSFDSGSSEMVEEVITIHYEDIEESWPATTKLD